MMALGDLRFSLDTAAYQQLREHTSWRWSVLPRLGRVDARQATGREAATISLSGRVYPGFVGDLGFFQAFKDAGNRAEPMILSDGVGHIYGKWVIEFLEETKSVFFADGIPRLVEFRMGLAEYGEDQ